MAQTWHRLRPALWVAALLLLTFLAAAASARADQGIQILDSAYEVQFSKSIQFRLQVETENDITAVTLYYRRPGEGLTVKVPIEVSEGEDTFSHTWELEPGELPLGSQIEHEWRIADAAGNELTTLPVTLNYEDDRFSWDVIQHDNIILFWYGSQEDEARRLVGYADSTLARLQDEMGVMLDQPVRIYVYRNKSDMSLALPRTSEAYDERILTLGVVVDEATLLLLGSQRDIEGTIAHELSHIVVGLATDNPYSSLPRWLDEGLAMYAEGELPSANRRSLERAVQRDQLISVRSLSGYTGDPSQVDLFYGEVYSLVEYLLDTYGEAKMARLLGALGDGITQEEALQRAYELDLDELDAQWRRSLGLQPRGTPTLGTPVAAPEAQRPRVPCSVAFLGAFLAVAVGAFGGKRARAS